MAADATLRTAALLLTAVLLATGIGGTAPLYVLALVQGALTMILLAGTPAAIAEIVAPEHRSAANALEMLAFTASGALGPFLAGLLANRIPVAAALPLAALCYATFSLVIAPMSLGGGRSATPVAPIQWRDSGVFQPTVAIITVMFLIINIAGGAIAVFLPVLVDHGLGRDADTYGTLLAVMGIGGSLGALAAGTLTGTARLPAAVATIQCLIGLALLPIIWNIDTPHPSLALTIVSLFFFGLFSGPLTVWAQTIRMRFIAPQWRGRAFATMRMIMQSGRPIGGALGGLAIAEWDIAPCLVAAAATIIAPAAVALLHPAMNRRLPPA
jgi:predicted MFS family arabinose efflux permease